MLNRTITTDIDYCRLGPRQTTQQRKRLLHQERVNETQAN